MEPTTGSANLPIQRSWTRRIGTGFRKWRFSRPTRCVDSSPASSRIAQVLHDPEPRHRGERLAQLTERLAIALEEPIEQDPTTGVAEGPKDRGHVVCHAAEYM